MAVSYHRAAYRQASPQPSQGKYSNLTVRIGELLGLLCASTVVALGLWLVYQAKTANPEKTSFVEIETALREKSVVNLNRLGNAQELEPFLASFPSDAERKFAAQKIFDFVASRQKQLPNVGALSSLAVTQAEVDADEKLETLRVRLARLRKNEAERAATGASITDEPPIPLLTGAQLRLLKPSLIVRTPEQFRADFLKWCGLGVLIFYIIHAVWRWRRFDGDRMILPLIHLLTGVGLMLMVSIRDPLRDSLSFIEFAMGILIGTVLLLGTSLIDYQRRFSPFAILPLLAALGLSVLLLAFGTGPGASDAKVNLFSLQPVEFIKILIVFFLAGYLASNWEFIRELRQKGSGVLDVLGRLNAPRLVYFLPVVIAMGVVLLFFFLQKDLGPALVLGATFLALYAVTRHRVMLVAGGLAILVAGVWFGYWAATPFTVYQRLRIWLDPWDNGLRNGDQIAHGFWAFATGGITGTGLGLGDTNFIPAGHTDLVLAAIGEEIGFIGVATVTILYVLLVARGLRAALRAPGHYTFFLALGLTLITAFQITVISAGVLGLMPLSGVVSPFLSYGKSSMFANCIVFGILLAISSERPAEDRQKPFRVPVRKLAAALAVMAAILIGKAAYLQIVSLDNAAIAPALTKQGDGNYRYQYNPRLIEITQRLPQGSIYDRNGVVLASGKWEELEGQRQQLELLGVNIETACAREENRHYPFGGQLFHLLGNVRTRENWGAPNADYVERDYIGRLRGFDDHAELVKRTVIEFDPKTRQAAPKEITTLRRDFRELLPLLKYRNRPGQSDAQALLQRKRDLRLSIDVRLQLRTAELLKQQITQQGREKGSAVVLDTASGDVLAMASYPWPADVSRSAKPVLAVEDEVIDEREDLLDRARWGYYPPGSTFKLVTAMAALRKDSQLANKSFECKSLGNGRVGNTINGWSRPIRDNEGDVAHGSVRMEAGMAVSCNAYFAQLGAYEVGAADLLQSAGLMGIEVAQPNNASELNKHLPQSAYGQGEVLVTPFRLARVAAIVANGGQMPFGRWVIDDSNQRAEGPKVIMPSSSADFLARAMRGVVERGTAKRLSNITPAIAGKTGTAEVEGKPSHSWFTGFAPVKGIRRIAFAVIIENGGYGGSAAAPVAGEIVKSAGALGLIR
jgi:cell division protein FtsW (lipid II flippase)/cell division protein FtsI/penicillin-binding protein 2